VKGPDAVAAEGGGGEMEGGSRNIRHLLLKGCSSTGALQPEHVQARTGVLKHARTRTPMQPSACARTHVHARTHARSKAGGHPHTHTPEHDDLVLALALVPCDEELAGHELVGVHDVHELLAPRVLRVQVLPARAQCGASWWVVQCARRMHHMH